MGLYPFSLRASKTERRIRCMFSRSSPGTVNLMVLSFNTDSSFFYVMGPSYNKTQAK